MHRMTNGSALSHTSPQSPPPPPPPPPPPRAGLPRAPARLGPNVTHRRRHPTPGGPSDDRRPRALGADPRRIVRDGRGDRATLAGAGYNISGIHLDFRGPRPRRRGHGRIEAEGVQALYINMNAADDEKRAAALAAMRERFVHPSRPAASLISGSSCIRSRSVRSCRSSRGPEGRRRPQEDGDDPGRHGQQPRLLGPGPAACRILGPGIEDHAMTSEGSTRVVPSYVVVSSAKAALELHVRQLAMELALIRHRQRLHPGGRDDHPGPAPRSPSPR